MTDEENRVKNFLFLDCETYYDNSKAVGYDLRKLDIVSYVRDPRFKLFGIGIMRDGREGTWYPEETFFSSFESPIDWKNTILVSQNIKFDGFILAEKYGIIAGQYIDTLAMSRAVLGKTIKSHSLESLAVHFGFENKGHLNTNGKKTLTWQENEELAKYCLHDVDLCRSVYNKLAPEFPENQYEIMDQTIRMFVNPKLRLNVPLLEQTAKNEALRRVNIFKDIGIDKKVFASNIKFPKLLESKGYYVPMKPSPKKKDVNGEPLQIPALALGDIDFLEMLEGENEELKSLCEARVAAKSTLLESRAIRLAGIGHTGSWPFDVEFSGADQTHRFSGGSGAGGNPQNFTRGSALRQAIEAPEGFELVVGDFSNIELRLAAYLSKDPGLIGSIESGQDIYCDFASAFYGRTITKEDKEARRFGKTACLGLQYGLGSKRFIKTVRLQTGQTINEDVSRKAVELYRMRYAQIPALWIKLDQIIPVLADKSLKSCLRLPITLEKERLILPSGLAIQFPNLRQEAQDTGFHHTQWIYDIWKNRHIEKRTLYGGKMLENICQGLAGEICKLAMLEMGDCVVGQVHDEVLCLAKKGLGNIIETKLKRAMTISPSWLPNLKLDAEIKRGANWLQCK